ncbi:MAG: glycosyltransferase [Actinomycetota bacterium]
MGEALWSLKAALRRLWADHVIWTRQYVVAAVEDTPDVDAAAGRLLKNQEDIGGAVVPYYGEAAGAAVTDLLKQHILIAVELIEAAKAGDDEKFKAEDAKWTQNADEIAGLLSGANPNWPKKDVVDLLGLHLSLTKQEVVARLQKDWAADVEAFDQIFTEILTVADVLADGIVKQFPDRFKG